MNNRKELELINAVKTMYSLLPNKPEYIGSVPIKDIFAWLDRKNEYITAVAIPTIAYITNDNRLSVSADLNALKRYETLKNGIRNNSDIALIQQAVDKARDLANTIEDALAGEEPYPATYHRMCQEIIECLTKINKII